MAVTKPCKVHDMIHPFFRSNHWTCWTLNLFSRKYTGPRKSGALQDQFVKSLTSIEEPCGEECWSQVERKKANKKLKEYPAAKTR